MDERVRFIAEVRLEKEPFSETCRRFRISRKTGYKWLDRYEQVGPQGLAERAPVARSYPWSVSAELVDVIVRTRKDHSSWGPKKLRAYLQESMPSTTWPAASTIGDVLKRMGQIRPRRRRARLSSPTSALDAGSRPNDVWATDFKGHFALGDRTRCHPLTISDSASRYLITCEALLAPTTEAVKPHFERAFREFGVPLRMRSDNGAPFASTGLGGLTELSVWWIRLGITPERIEPAKPQQNGRHERMHRTLKAEATRPSERDCIEQQRVFDRFLREYNDVRPHEALGQSPPSKHYVPSPRPYPPSLLTPEYVDMDVRWVQQSGEFQWRGHLIYASTLLTKQPIGLRQVTESRFEVFYGPQSLGVLDERDAKPSLRPAHLSRRGRRSRDAEEARRAVEMPSSGTSQEPLAPDDLDNAARCPHPHSPDDDEGCAEETP